MKEEDLKDFLGPVGFREYEQAPDYDKPKIQEWADKVAAMNDRDFILETASKILDDAIMGNRSQGNNYGFYARTTGCFQEAKRRHLKAGHTEECRGDTLYAKGHRKAMISQRHTPSDPYPCDCGRDK